MVERPSEKAADPKTEEELLDYIREMIKWPDGSTEPGEGYGRCVYAIAYASVATFNFVASTLGCTGFQASCADMEILSQTRLMKHGFLILDAENLLYPQYDLLAKAAEWIEKTRPQLADAARKRLETAPGAHPAVVKRWEEIAALAPPGAAATT